MKCDFRFLGRLSPGVFLCLFTAFVAPSASGADNGFADPLFRVETDGFDASEADIKAICTSAGRELWKYFPDYDIEPFVVQRSRTGPIVWHNRNDEGEIVMRLDTHNTLWSQYAYQFAHEFCHILSGFENDDPGNRWFEETLCETASVFAIRAMARSWKDDPPYSNWKDYRHALAEYADNVIVSRKEVLEIYEKGLGGFYRAHREELTKNAGLRNLNGAMALVFLRLFEEDPRRWEAVRWLNHRPSPPSETFPEHLQKWYNAVPARHRAFVATVARLYNVEIDTSAAPPPPEVVEDPRRPAKPGGYATPPVPKYRVDADGFGASERDIRAVCDSAGRELWRHFPTAEIEPFVVSRGTNGPTVLYGRNAQGEIVIKLNTQGTSWAQYTFQFSQMFARILVRFDQRSVGNSWFESAVCDTASLFALRAMSRAWEHDPPYVHWKDYRHALAKYAQNILDSRKQLTDDDLADYYRKHRDSLAAGDVPREVTGAIACVLLRLLEETPEHWEAVHWLNQQPSAKGEPFVEYLARWQKAAPDKHKAFITKIAELFGEKIATK